MGADLPVWPELSYSSWHETAATLHLWTQIVGKVRLSLTPWLNHDTPSLALTIGTHEA